VSPNGKPFKASRGWVKRWMERNHLVVRRRTNNHKLSADDRKPWVLRHLWKIRRIQKSAPADGRPSDPVYGRHARRNIFNVDQVPVEDDDKDSKHPHPLPFLCGLHIHGICVFLLCFHCKVCAMPCHSPSSSRCST
jgi:hypothetical protein